MHYKKLVMSFVLGGSHDKFKDHRSIKLLPMKSVCANFVFMWFNENTGITGHFTV